ncbi:glycosyltransferase [Motilimonas sp. E26]|uniref:glycosyltransferase n=1 Tax=Motilimonas sp. E26 TaxID=2865674 RepID=UPI001E63CA33|nr:glycosyltransferase [Motilimonas sp. E26]MCE0558548.1 glycosyltransferase [Motilimonas sp. E26]
MKIVISGVNLVEGGTLTVFKDVISAFSIDKKIEVICLVNDKSLFSNIKGVHFISFPGIKNSWVKRCWFEYVSCKKIAESIKPDLWLAMHDMTPNVGTCPQYVYCHNPSPFLPVSFKLFWYEPKVFLFSIFYKWLYRINIKKNIAVIAQQEWFGHYLTDVLGAKQAIIARPVSFSPRSIKKLDSSPLRETIVLFYPALARTFKNFELLLNCFAYLKKEYRNVYNSFELQLTIDENENKFASTLVNRYRELENVKFLGRLNFEEVKQRYENCDIVVFPSKLETWGLPISEAKLAAKPIILSDLPYAHETLGDYHSALFVDPDDYITLANAIVDLFHEKNIFHSVKFQSSLDVIDSWPSLVSAMVK